MFRRPFFAAAAAALFAGSVLTLALVPVPAGAADDTLTLIGSDFPPNVSDVEDIVAERAGYFAQERLAVTKQFSGSSSNCFQIVASGKGDICTSSVEAIILGYSKGLRLQVFLNRDPRYDYTLAVLSDSPIRHLADFKGAVIGEINLGGIYASEIPANAVLSGAGLSKSDYSFAPVGVGAQALAAIESKRVAALAFPTLELDTMQVAGHVTFRTFPDPRLGDVPNVGFVATPSTIASKSDLLRRYARAMVKAFVFIRVNPQAAARMFLEGSAKKATDDALATAIAQIEALEPDFPAYDLSDKRIGYIPVRGMAVYCEYFATNGLTPDLVPAEALVTNQFGRIRLVCPWIV